MSTSGFPLAESELLGTLLEGALYGFSLLMFGATVWVLLSRWSSQKINRVMFVAACLFLLFSTAHFIIGTIRITDAFILHGSTPGGPTAFLADVAQWSFVSKNCVYAVQTIVADSVILYRCYMVWKSKLIMILPVLLWCGAGASGIGAAAEASLSTTFSGNLLHWVKAFYATTFVTNVLTTTLLAGRIWYIDRKATRLRGHRTSQLRQVVHIIVDSGVIYNVTLVALWICFSYNSNGQFLVIDIIMPIISITFYMVIIRVGLAVRATRSTKEFSSTGNSSYGDRRSNMAVHITSLTQKRADNDLRPPMSPTSFVDNESSPARDEGNFDVTRAMV